MKFATVSILAVLLSGTAAGAAPIDTVISRLRAQGFTGFEVKQDAGRVKVEASDGNNQRELVYDARDGRLLSDETNGVHRDAAGRPDDDGTPDRGHGDAPGTASSDDTAGDDHGGDRRGSDDPAGHDADDDHGGDRGGSDGPAGHDAGDDHGGDRGGSDDSGSDDNGGNRGGSDDSGSDEGGGNSGHGGGGSDDNGGGHGGNSGHGGGHGSDDD